MDVKLSLNEEHVQRIEQALSRPPTRFWQSDNLLRAAQILALVIGGSWVLIQFLLFERSKIALENKVLEADIAAKESLQRQSLIDEERKSVELVGLKTYRFRAERSIAPTFVNQLDEKTALYNVHYQIKVTNESNVPLEISMWVLDYFTGELSKELQHSTSFIAPIGYPENRWNSGSATSGAVVWKRVGSNGAIFSEAFGNIQPTWQAVVEDVDLATGGGLTGALSPGQSYSMSDDFLVKGTPGEYVAFVQNICFQRCKENNDLYHTSEYQLLPFGPPAASTETVQSTASPTGSGDLD